MAEPHDPAPLGERVLWSSRILLLGGVAGSVLLAVAVIWIGTVDLVRFLGDAVDYARDGDSDARGALLVDIVKIVDAYLFAAILVVAAFGLYELFVGRLDARRTDGDAPRILVARSLDDVKDRIAKLLVLILVIEFFQRALQIRTGEATDLLVLAGGIALVSLALVLPTLAESLRRAPDPQDATK